MFLLGKTAVQREIDEIDALLDQGLREGWDNLVTRRGCLVRLSSLRNDETQTNLTDEPIDGSSASTHGQAGLIVVIAPNVGELMGGEAMKALWIFKTLYKLRPNTVLITHGRNRTEIARLGLNDVHFVDDTILAVLLWRSVVLRYIVDFWFGKKATELAERLAANTSNAIIFQAEPNSPVLPRALARNQINVLGPVNGNIYYPKAFQRSEKLRATLRRLLHFPVQRFNKLFFRGITKADLILTAGGARTRNSLMAAGCRLDVLVESIDCGIDDALLNKPQFRHRGFNPRFVHFGRLVFHKGTFLAIKSLAKTTSEICLDVIGHGPELEACKILVTRLGLIERVNFIKPFTSQADLFKSLNQYRALVLPSMEDANGMVVQEAMALGLPAVCLNWGGPQLLVNHGRTGFLIEPDSEEQIIDDMAKYLDQLAVDGSMADSFSAAGRESAEGWRWSTTVSDWVTLFDQLAQNNAGKRRCA